ncbi:MAG: molecular chaperone DnaJ [Oscillospiraceae bacterium]|nr:molecular chaperone DnaJ [Oscillospiraceae bacterium]
MPSKRDFYDVLGVPKGSSADDIKKAYRQKAKDCHPDLHPDDANAVQKMQEVNEAYEVLSDDKKKARYDQYGHAGVDPNNAGGFGGGNPFGGFGSGFGGEEIDLGDILGSFFGGGQSRRNPTAPRRGEDVQIRVNLTFLEAAKGCRKTVSYKRVENCPECSGSGAAKGTTAQTCTQCGGRGSVTVTKTMLGMNMRSEQPCPVCHGRGKVITSPCHTCKGNGQVAKSVSTEVDVPAGIDDRQVLNVRGGGSTGANGGPPGSLHMVMAVQQDVFFERDGFNIWCEYPISYATAALGGKAQVSTIDGKAAFDIPAGTQPGKVFSLKGKGIPVLNGRGRGDQFIRISIAVPEYLNIQQKELLRAFEASFGDANSLFDHGKSGLFGKKK